MLKMRKYTNANSTAGIFVNFVLFIGCLIVGLMRMTYLKINHGSVAVGSEYVFCVNFFTQILDIQVPAQQRMISLFLWQTFCPLVVLFWSKLYQRFAVKRMKRLAKGLEDLVSAAGRKLKMTKISVSPSKEAKDARLNHRDSFRLLVS